MQELATIWASSTSYVVNQLVLQDEKLYRCAVAHTSGGTFIADLQAAYWVEISASAVSGINYVTNPNAEVDTSGWATYAESDAVTFQDAGDTVTLNSHGLSNGTAISFTSITSTTGISINTLYYVVNAATNTFQVATSVGGSALALTTNGSGTLVRSIPKLGTGGSPAVTFTRNTSSPLRGDADFRAAKDAANRMGQGVSYDFTIDDADLAKVLTLTFDYELITATGTYANADLVIYLIQDPTGTPVVIQPAGYRVLSAASALPQRQIATFQTSSSVKSYRLCVHVASVSATAYTLAIDNVSVGPQVVQYGAPVTDWQAYTCTVQGSTSNPTVTANAYWRRVGDSLQVWMVSGAFSADGSGYYTFPLPSGLSIDTTKGITLATGLTDTSGSWSGTLGSVVGNAAVKSSSSFKLGSAEVLVASTTSVCVGINLQSSAATPNIDLIDIYGSGNVPTSVGGNVSMNFTVPILGWSSTVQMSNDTDTRVVAAEYVGTPTNSVSGSDTIVVWPTRVSDTHSAYSSGSITIPVPGFYQFSASVYVQGTYSSGNWVRLVLYVDGVARRESFQVTPAVGVYQAALSVSSIYLNAGQVVTFRVSTNSSSPIMVAGNNVFMTFGRLAGPSAIAASETVAARYFTSAGPTINNTTPIITYGTKVFDTHGAMSGNTYTIPISGKYWIQMHAYTSSYAATAASFCEGIINKNGNFHSFLFSKRIDAAVTAPQSGGGSCIVDCLAGDTIQFRVGTGVATTLSTTQTDTGNFIGIYRIGN